MIAGEVGRGVPDASPCGIRSPIIFRFGKPTILNNQLLSIHTDVVFAIHIRQGFPLDGIFEQASHKVRTGTVRSTCSAPPGGSCKLVPQLSGSQARALWNPISHQLPFREVYVPQYPDRINSLFTIHYSKFKTAFLQIIASFLATGPTYPNATWLESRVN